MKAKLALNVARKALYKRNFWCSTSNQLFNSMVEPILLYGCEIWGTSYETKKLDAIGAAFANEALGIRKSAPKNYQLLYAEEDGRKKTAAKEVYRVAALYIQ